MHPFAIDRQGNLFVDLGSATNSCQVQNRTLESPGIGSLSCWRAGARPNHSITGHWGLVAV
jgi:hypothetical protein